MDWAEPSTKEALEKQADWKRVAPHWLPRRGDWRERWVISGSAS